LVTTNEAKISVVHLGVEARFQPIREESQLTATRQKYGLPGKFVLFVGLIEPRKNLETLVDAYLADSLCEGFDLVLAGNLGWDYSRLLKKVAASGVRNRIHMPGYIDDADLPALYSMAAAFVYPSLYEGFGLPVLEAMACGAPVITSGVSSLPEVAGDAAILVDPRDCRAVAGALRMVLGDEELREDLSQRGRQRSQLFTWERTAGKTLDVYRAAAGQ
jgi:glycosyltransferase involved in cell wall biosynthesis